MRNIPDRPFWPWTPLVTEATFREIEAYRPRYGSFFDEISAELKEFISKGAIRRARLLADETRHHFNWNWYPQFFTGDLDAELVIVHLNPKQPDDIAARYEGELPVKKFEEYFDVSRHFGQRMPRDTISQFDDKQIRFLRPFGLIDFVDESLNDARWTNRQRVVDCKLQLELIPYGSNSFNASALKRTDLNPHFERVLRVISARPRQYVLFCGKVFTPLLHEFLVGGEQEFHLVRQTGDIPEKMRSFFANLSIPFSSKEITGGWCRSWARQGINVDEYAKKVLRWYRP